MLELRFILFFFSFIYIKKGTTFQSVQYFACPANTIFDVSLGACNHASTTVCKS